MPSRVLQVRLPRADLEALDRHATALGVARSDLVRRLIRTGLAAEDAPIDAGAPFSLPPAPQVESWQVVAQRLEFEHPEHWAPPDLPEPE
jgi:hypothetical protein